jgi:hypothetical protein
MSIRRGRQREVRRISALELRFNFDAEFHLVTEEFDIL